MSSPTTYSYTVNSEGTFLNKALDIPRFTQEIRASAIVVALDAVAFVDGNCDVTFRDVLSSDDVLLLETLVRAHTGEPIPVDSIVISGAAGKPVLQNPDGAMLSSVEPRIGDEVIYTTHNLCDKCTWYSNSVRVVGELLIDSGDHLIFSSSNTHWVDMVSGRMQDDDGLADEQRVRNPGDPHGYQVVGKVDGVEVAMREPFEASGGDYEVVWEEGKVRFFAPVTGSVTFDYSYATDSEFVLEPLDGKDLHIEAAEADFTHDVVMTDGIEYNVYAYAAAVAPQLGLPAGTRVKVSSTKYKRFSNIVQEAVGAHPDIPPIGASAGELQISSIDEFRRKSRGMRTKCQAIPFRYATIRELMSQAGVQLRVKLTHDRPLEGESATLTFYCTSHDADH